MVSEEYANAYSEVYEILKYIPIDEYNKIPDNVKKLIKENKSKEYKFKYDASVDFDKQNLSKLTMMIISILYKDYFATPEERAKIDEIQRSGMNKLEKQKEKKYSVDNIFKQNITPLTVEKESTDLIEYKEPVWYEKVISFFKRLFKRGR